MFRLHKIIVRKTGVRLRAKRMHALTLEETERLLPEPEHGLAVTSSLAVLHGLGPQITTVETLVQPSPLTGEGEGESESETQGTDRRP